MGQELSYYKRRQAQLRDEYGADPRKVDTSGGQYDGIMLTHAALASNSFGDRYPHQE